MTFREDALGRKKKVILQLMGLKCFKCHRSMGALCIPIDHSQTPETLGAFLTGERILPECMSCIGKNPSLVGFDEIRDGR